MSDATGKVRVGGLWSNTSKTGSEYLSGNFGQAKILIFPNGYKKSGKEPDWILYIAEGKKPEQRASAPSAPPTPDSNDADFEDDIPF